MKKLWFLPLMLLLLVACDKDDDTDDLTQLATPNLQSPADNATLQAPSFAFTFSWSESIGADEYELELAGNENFTNSSTLISSGTSIQITSNDVVEGETYYWRVRALAEGFITSNDSEAFRFVYTVGSGGGGGGGSTDVPTLLTPANNATVNTNTPTFTWTDVELQASFYVLQVSQSLDFNNIIRTYQPTSESFTVPNAADGIPGNPPSISLGTYFWRVSADNGDTFSDFFTITIE